MWFISPKLEVDVKIYELSSGVMSIRRPLSEDVCEGRTRHEPIHPEPASSMVRKTPLIPLFCHAHGQQLGLVKSNIVLLVQFGPV